MVTGPVLGLLIPLVYSIRIRPLTQCIVLTFSGTLNEPVIPVGYDSHCHLEDIIDGIVILPTP